MSKMDIKYMVLGPVATNVYLVRNEERGEVVIIDPSDRADRIAATIKEAGDTPVAILLTHGHHDHIGAVEELKKEFGIEVYAHKDELALLADPSMSFARGITVTPDKLVEEGDKLSLAGFDIRVLHTPGHTAGSCCYYLPEENVLFAGDTLFCGSYGRTDLPTGDQATIEKSVARLLTDLPEDTAVCPGHESFTTVEFERRYNPLRPK